MTTHYVQTGKILTFENPFPKMEVNSVWRVMNLRSDGSFTLERLHDFVIDGNREQILTSDDKQLIINCPEHYIFVNNVEIKLTKTEWKLLEIFMSMPNKVVTSSALLTYAWGKEFREDFQYLRVWVSRLRSKLGEKYIQTHQGYGYSFHLNV